MLWETLPPRRSRSRLGLFRGPLGEGSVKPRRSCPVTYCSTPAHPRNPAVRGRWTRFKHGVTGLERLRRVPLRSWQIRGARLGRWQAGGRLGTAGRAPALASRRTARHRRPAHARRSCPVTSCSTPAHPRKPAVPGRGDVVRHGGTGLERLLRVPRHSSAGKDNGVNGANWPYREVGPGQLAVPEAPRVSCPGSGDGWASWPPGGRRWQSAGRAPGRGRRPVADPAAGRGACTQ